MSLMRLLALWILIGAALSIQGAAFASEEQRVALVIGNGSYRSAPLKNAANDAKTIADALKSTGFKTHLRVNASRDEIVEALRLFVRAEGKNVVRMLFYAGHGLQIKGRNYLVPVDSEGLTEETLASKAIDITEVMERLAAERTGINIVVLDACRDNPFIANLTKLADARRGRTRSMSGPSAGLAEVRAASGTLVAFSTAPGSVAADGAGQANSVYTRHLVGAMLRPGQSIERVFKQVRVNVALETQQAQIPWESSSLMGDFCFIPKADGGCR
jgi:uncharacterized caspase-like protein